jgi:signal recognition particle GTPase
MHENYYYCFSRADNLIIKNKFKELGDRLGSKITYNGHRWYNNKFISLINNEVWYTMDYIHTVLIPNSYSELFAPEKVLILGNNGSGKSTLAGKLSEKLNITAHYLGRYAFNSE